MYQHIATHCNTLQHTATHCNTLQHTATHCNNVCVYILWITCMRSTKKLPRNGPTWSIEYFFYIHIHTRVAARNSNCCDRKRYYWWNIHIQKYLHTHSQRSNNECCERNRHFWWICIIHHTYTPLLQRSKTTAAKGIDIIDEIYVLHTHIHTPFAALNNDCCERNRHYWSWRGCHGGSSPGGCVAV